MLFFVHLTHLGLVSGIASAHPNNATNAAMSDELREAMEGFVLGERPRVDMSDPGRVYKRFQKSVDIIPSGILRALDDVGVEFEINEEFFNSDFSAILQEKMDIELDQKTTERVNGRLWVLGALFLDSRDAILEIDPVQIKREEVHRNITRISDQLKTQLRENNFRELEEFRRMPWKRKIVFLLTQYEQFRIVDND